jgi:hypothetical protein
MEYACLIYTPTDAPQPSREQFNAMLAEYGAYTEATKKAGIWRLGQPLQPPTTATTVRMRSGNRLTTDGPFAETKEWLAGLYIFECASLDEALDWAAKCPGAKYGSIEVRPLMEIQARV